MTSETSTAGTPLPTSSRPEVVTTHGPVRGRSADGVAAFLAVPYAAPPFGPRRFAPPEPPEPWTGPRDCTALGATAPKPPYRAVVADLLPEPVVPGEDCLHVNVWTPSTAVGHPDAARPVLVWVHGGSFQNGSNAVPVYDGSRFARDGVVLVSVNYRLGVDGFARLAGAPDNRGLLDQVAALTWVRDNIAHFGGDPDRVTLVGESAGAMGVTTLTAVPAARGLFHRVVAQSGAGHHVVHPATADLVAAELAGLLGVAPTAEAFAAVPVPDLLAAHHRLADMVAGDPDPARWGEVVRNVMPFEPVVDGVLLPGVPAEVVARGEGAEVDLLVGSNDDEHALFLHPLLDLVDEPRARAVLAAHGAAEDAYATYVAQTGARRPGDVLVAALSDWFFRLPALRLAESRLALGLDTHVYEFGWRTPVLDGVLGACHALEIGFVFDTLDVPEGQALTGTDPPQPLADDMHRAWVRFATDGDPGWPAYGTARATRRFGGAHDGEVLLDPEPVRRQLWPQR